MKSVILYPLFIFLMIPFLTPKVSNAQKKIPELSTILDKHADAIGLNSRIKINTLLSFGTITQLGTELEITILQKRPDKYRLDVHLAEGRITQSYDGVKGWSLNPFISPDTIPIIGQELLQLQESALFDGLLFNAPELDYKLSLIGEDDKTTVPSYIVELKKQNGDKLRFFISKKDYLVHRTEASVIMQGMKYEMYSKFSDFRTMFGITVPYLIENNNGQLSAVTKIDKIRINEKIEDGLFTGRKAN